MLGVGRNSHRRFRVLRRSLDARKGASAWLSHAGRGGETQVRDLAPSPGRAPARPSWPVAVPLPRVVIVGSGPAGAWAALRLAEAGVASTILERGKPVGPRRADIASVHRGQLKPESNYCFGEGGAGTYSDGKLYTRCKDRGGSGRRAGRPGGSGRAGRHRGRCAATHRIEPLPKLLEALRDASAEPGRALSVRLHFPRRAQEQGRIRNRPPRRRAAISVSAWRQSLAYGHSLDNEETVSNRNAR